MSIDIRVVTAAANGFSGVPTYTSYDEEGAVASAGVALSSFYASYGNKTDHEIKIVQGYASTVTRYGGVVGAPLTGVMNDDSGNQATTTVCAAFPVQLS